MDVKYAWLNSFCSAEERALREKINNHIAQESLGRCGCGELKVIVSGDFVTMSYKARILCRCNAIQNEFRGALQNS